MVHQHGEWLDISPLRSEYLDRRAEMSRRIDEMEETDPNMAASARRILNLPKNLPQRPDIEEERS
jgi:hypothetical protein